MPASRQSFKTPAPAVDSEQQTQVCNDIEAEIMGLKAAYDQYFLGMERMPPTKRHDALKKQVNALKNAFVRQTALKFRIGSVAQKFSTYERLWERTLQEIENGTYKRDLFKLKHKAGDQKKKAALPGASNFDIDEDLDLSDIDGDLDSAVAAASEAVEARIQPPAPPPVSGVGPAFIPPVAPAVTTRPNSAPAIPSIAPVRPVSGPIPAIKPVTGGVPAARPLSGPVAAVAPPTVPIAARPLSGGVPATRPLSGPVPAVGKATVPSAVAANSSSGLSEQKIKAIYDAYVSAKKRCGEDTSKLSLGGVAETLKKQVPELMKSHNAKSVEFKVVIKEGKAILRAMPKE